MPRFLLALILACGFAFIGYKDRSGHYSPGIYDLILPAAPATSPAPAPTVSCNPNLYETAAEASAACRFDIGLAQAALSAQGTPAPEGVWVAAHVGGQEPGEAAFATGAQCEALVRQNMQADPRSLWKCYFRSATGHAIWGQPLSGQSVSQ
jgi:hypothetical protein